MEPRSSASLKISWCPRLNAAAAQCVVDGCTHHMVDLRESHEVGVATQAGPGGRTATLAYCSCGWQGPRAYGNRDDAKGAAFQHFKGCRPNDVFPGFPEEAA